MGRTFCETLLSKNVFGSMLSPEFFKSMHNVNIKEMLEVLFSECLEWSLCVKLEMRYKVSINGWMPVIHGNSTPCDTVVIVWAISVRGQFNSAVHCGGWINYIQKPNTHQTFHLYCTSVLSVLSTITLLSFVCMCWHILSYDTEIMNTRIG